MRGFQTPGGAGSASDNLSLNVSARVSTGRNVATARNAARAEDLPLICAAFWRSDLKSASRSLCVEFPRHATPRLARGGCGELRFRRVFPITAENGPPAARATKRPVPRAADRRRPLACWRMGAEHPHGPPARACPRNVTHRLSLLKHVGAGRIAERGISGVARPEGRGRCGRARLLGQPIGQCWPP